MPPRLAVRTLLLVGVIGALVLAPPAAPLDAQEPPLPTVTLVPTSPLRLPGPVDSNSPAFWALENGEPRLYVVQSRAGALLAAGPALAALAPIGEVEFTEDINGARWIEAVIPDVDGTLYGYYHNEPSGVCGRREGITAPRIGAARSRDLGRTWEDLGIILEAPPGTLRCDTRNRYFAGGVGDFSAILDRDQTDLYFFFSAYSGPRWRQGVALARMLWADRDAPQGKVAIWNEGRWEYPTPVEDEEGTIVSWIYPPATPIYPAAQSWHDPSGRPDAFWGPSVHWNTYLRRYVMLLNHAIDRNWTQEGIYIAYSAAALDDPLGWSTPQRLFTTSAWYPQVFGLEPGSGTDRLAGRVARFFVGGSSEHLIVFRRPAGSSSPWTLGLPSTVGFPQRQGE
jgi:hypothetical protein